MNKHTPGPWIFDPSSESVRIKDGKRKYGNEIAIIVYQDVGQSVVSFGPETVANARLVAAAPDLYEAAELALIYLSNVNAADPSDVATKLISALRAAGANVPDVVGGACSLVAKQGKRKQ